MTHYLFSFFVFFCTLVNAMDSIPLQDASPLLEDSFFKNEILVFDVNDTLDRLIPFLEDLKRINNIDYSEMLVAFDVDGTLTNLDPRRVVGDDKLRGGIASRRLFEYLNGTGIKWFALSARCVSEASTQSVASTLYGLFNNEGPEWSYKPINCFGGKDRFGGNIWKPLCDKALCEEKKFEFKFEDTLYNTFQCNNIISAAQSGQDYAFDKNISLEYAISIFFPEQYPKLALFIDDNAANVMTVYYHFKEPKNQHKGTSVVNILHEPHKPESDHAEWREVLIAELKQPAEINLHL